MKGHTSLKTFDVSHNRLGQESGRYLSECLLTRTLPLTNLDVSWNYIRGEKDKDGNVSGAVSLGLSLAENATLTKLDLGFNAFEDAGTQAIGLSLEENCTLTSLDLSHNRITGRPALVLAHGLEVNTSLKVLVLNGNPLENSLEGRCFGFLLWERKILL